MIPTTSRHVDLSTLSPLMIERLEAFFKDSLITPPGKNSKVAVVSAGRTKAQQAKLRKRYLDGKSVLAADPERTIPGGGGFFKGSWHMVQPGSGYAHAVDFRIVGKGLTTDQVNECAITYGLVPTIRSKEWWHHQERDAVGAFDAPAMGGKPAKEIAEAKIDWVKIGEYVDAIGRSVALSPLRKGSRGSEVKLVQIMVANQGYDPGYADGVYGRRTLKAIKDFQASRELTKDGITGAKTYFELRKA